MVSAPENVRGQTVDTIDFYKTKHDEYMLSVIELSLDTPETGTYSM